MPKMFMSVAALLVLGACQGSPQATAGGGFGKTAEVELSPAAAIPASIGSTVEIAVAPRSIGEVRSNLSTGEGRPAQTVYLVPASREERRRIADSMRRTGFGCSAVARAYRVRVEDGRFTDLWKIDCDAGTFRATMLRDRLFIAAWEAG